MNITRNWKKGWFPQLKEIEAKATVKSKLTSDNDSEDQESEEKEDHKEFQEKLSDWIIDTNMPRTHVISFLSILKPCFPSLAKDYRTIIATPHTYAMDDIAGGDYHHFGVTVKETRSRQQVDEGRHSVSSQTNIDGLPLFKINQSPSGPYQTLFLRKETHTHLWFVYG